MRACKLFVISLSLGALAAADSAWACNCPKEYMIRKYGTVASVPPTKPAQPPAPAGDPVGSPRQDAQSGVQ